METNPNRGRRTSPPLVVYGSEPVPAPGPEPTGRWIDFGAAALFGAALAAAVTLALTGSVETPPCETALAASDDMAYASAEVGRAADAVAAGETVDIDSVRDDWNAAFDAYEAARDECGGA